MENFDLGSLHITQKILNIISELDEFKGAWAAVGRIAPDRLRNLRRVATIESIGSSTRIEGVQLSNQDIDRLLSQVEIKKFDTRDEQEVAGYAEVMDTVFSNWNHIDLTEGHIKQLHRDLLKFSSKDERHRGEYKTFANSVEAFDTDGKSLGVIFATASPFDTPKLMTELLAWFNDIECRRKLHTLLAIAIFIVAFLEIHPFQDGNGRLSRILTILLLLRGGYSYVPYSSLETIIEENKEGYYSSLRQTQTTIRTKAPNWLPWVNFFLKALLQQKQRLVQKMTRESIVLGKLPMLSVQILELVREHGRITVADLVKATGANRNTIKDHLKSLLADGHLVLHGAGRGSWYGLS
jgi:Fic family protein